MLELLLQTVELLELLKMLALLELLLLLLLELLELLELRNPSAQPSRRDEGLGQLGLLLGLLGLLLRLRRLRRLLHLRRLLRRLLHQDQLGLSVAEQHLTLAVGLRLGCQDGLGLKLGLGLGLGLGVRVLGLHLEQNWVLVRTVCALPLCHLIHAAMLGLRKCGLERWRLPRGQKRLLYPTSAEIERLAGTHAGRVTLRAGVLLKSPVRWGRALLLLVLELVLPLVLLEHRTIRKMARRIPDGRAEGVCSARSARRRRRIRWRGRHSPRLQTSCFQLCRHGSALPRARSRDRVVQAAERRAHVMVASVPKRIEPAGCGVVCDRGAGCA